MNYGVDGFNRFDFVLRGGQIWLSRDRPNRLPPLHRGWSAVAGLPARAIVQKDQPDQIASGGCGCSAGKHFAVERSRSGTPGNARTLPGRTNA